MGSLERLRAELATVEAGSDFSVLDLVTLPDEVQSLVSWVMRRKRVSLEEIAAYLGASSVDAREALGVMTQKGLLQEENGGYQVRFAPKQGRTVSRGLWDALSEEEP